MTKPEVQTSSSISHGNRTEGSVPNAQTASGNKVSPGSSGDDRSRGTGKWMDLTNIVAAIKLILLVFGESNSGDGPLAS